MSGEMETLGDRLRIARQKAGYKQVQVKEHTQINNKTLSGYENNISEPDINTLNKLAKLYNVSLDWLTTGIEKNVNSSNAEDQAAFEKFINDPNLQVFYKELPNSEEEEIEMLRDFWEIIKKNKKK